MLSLASLGLVALADFGSFRLPMALTVIALAAIGAAVWWRPPVSRRPRRPGWSALLAAAILLGGAALVAPGSQDVVGPRDPGVYVATGFAIARWGGTTIHDPALELLAKTVDPGQINAWLYTNIVNAHQIRFPAQLFVRNLARGTVEGGFLPVVPVWIALTATLGGLGPALHVTGGFGVLGLAFAMLASRAAAAGAADRPTPWWPIVGGVLALSFSQVWWARQPMAEPALGAFVWLAAWAAARWASAGGPRWAALASLATAAALFTRADGILLAAAMGLVGLLYGLAGRMTLLIGVGLGLAAAALHYSFVAPTYMSMTYGIFTLQHAIVGAAAVVLVCGGIALRGWLPHGVPQRGTLAAWAARLAPSARRWWIPTIVALAAVSAITGIGPRAGRDVGLAAASPLIWLPGYVPWPLLALAGLGLIVLSWYGAPRALVPLLLVGGLPALLYLPDPLVTGDNPWMVRRLVPAVIPLLAVLASLSAAALWRLDLRGRLGRLAAAGPLVAAAAVGLGLALTVAHDGDLMGQPDDAGALAGLQTLAATVPSNAVLIFQSGPTGIDLAMPLDAEYGVDSFAIPAPSLTNAIAATLGRMESMGYSTYWAVDGTQPPTLPAGVTATVVRTISIRFLSADHGPVPPPLERHMVNDTVTVYRIDVAHQ